MERHSYPVYVVDDEADARESLVFMLESYGFQAHGFESGRVFLDTVDLSRIGCLILDSRMPDLRGQEIQTHLNAQRSPLSILFLTGHGDVPMAVDVLKAGALDFFQKPVNSETLVAAIENAILVSDKKQQACAHQRLYLTLTGREQEVLRLMVKGLKNQEMADALYISLRTIEVHRSNVMKKLGVTRITDIMLRYGDMG